MAKDIDDYLEEFAKIADSWFETNQFVKNHSEWISDFFKKENLEKVEWPDIQELGNHIHAFGSNALARANAFGKPNYPIKTYRKSFDYLANGTGSITSRMRDFYYNNEKYSSKYLGEGALSEIIGNLFPEKFIFMNTRDKDAAEFLGIKPDYKRGDDFVTRFEKFNLALLPLVEKYKKIVGSKLNLPIGLQVDQFLFWLSEEYVYAPDKTNLDIDDIAQEDYRIWKISHGKSNDMSDTDHQLLLDHDLVAIGYSDPKEDKKKQGEKFKSEIKNGDYFYLVRQAHIVLWGKFDGEEINDVPENFTHQDWMARKIVKLKVSNFPSKELSKEFQAKSGWQPSYTSTIFEVPAKDYDKFEQGILSPVFNLTLPTSNEKEVGKEIGIADEKEYYQANNNIPLNQILYGPPGTGKTYNTVKESLKILENTLKPDGDYKDQKLRFDDFKSKGFVEFVTFHQSFSYEDFIEGIRADTDNKNINYRVEPGVLKKLVIKAEKDPENPYVLIIDEINRGNTSKIFGELITLIEESKRAGADELIEVMLPYSSHLFSIPKNLYIIGTMNTADRSLALMDTALRRRFDFIEMMPDPTEIKDENKQTLIVDTINIPKMLEVMNHRIEALYDREHTIGHAFFLELNSKSTVINLERIFKNKILPLLEEYFFEDWGKISKVLGKSGIYEEKQFEDLGFEYTAKNYVRVAEKLKDPNTYIAIYANNKETSEIG